MKVFKLLKGIVTSLLVISLICSVCVAIYASFLSQAYRIKMSYVDYFDVVLSQDAVVNNTILMIGDGMGVNHLEVTKAHNSIETLNMETLEVSGMMSTFSTFGVTDSAAAATAMSTGVKIFNGGISMEKNKNLETLGEYALKQGKSVGIISTEGVNGATPAGFSAHAALRKDYDTITNCQLESGIDLFIGANKPLYDSYQYQIEASGYSYATTYSSLDDTEEKIFACFNSISATNATNSEPSLSQLVTFAMDYLEDKSDNGYFLMIEGAYIDKKSHSNDMSGMIAEMKGFDEAVATVLEKAADDTFIMVTADHETGDLHYNCEKGADINDSLFKSGGHTGQDVPYFATAHIQNIPKKIDNTNIASIFRQLICGQS